jgi:hypothetical protein
MLGELARLVLVAATNADASYEALEAARRSRETGRGRRPSEQALERLRRRHGLDADAYAQTLVRLREMAPSWNGHGRDLASHPPDPAELLAATRRARRA